VNVYVHDQYWLRLHPDPDTVLLGGHSVIVPRRPSTITVVKEDGTLCGVNHAAGHEAKHYVCACGVENADWAYIAQPDGKVQRDGIALWNGNTQDEPAAGAWIWAPPRTSGWSDSFSEKLIRFLATQGPAIEQNAEPLFEFPAGASRKSAVTVAGVVDRNEQPPVPGGMSLGLAQSLAVAPGPATRIEQPTLPISLKAEISLSKARDLEVTASDWGSVGLLQTPTARMRPVGELALHYSRISPYGHINLFAQPFEWMEAGFRYTEISNRLYGPVEFSGTQSLKDKGIDVKFRVWKESAYLPEVAVGFRDIAGTGLFSGEYIVGSKRTGNFDWSLGLGWGYLGNRGDLRNPFSIFGSAFDVREGASGPGGQFAFKSYFRGATALFGGVQYQTPWTPLVLKAEYDSNNYQREPQGNVFPQSSPFNFGLVYRISKSVDLTAAIERGNTAMLGLTIHTDLAKLTQPKILDPAPVPVVAARPTQSPDWSATTRALEQQTNWRVRAIEQRENDIRVVIDDAEATYWRSRVDRANAVLHRDAPASVDRFTLSYRQRGVPIAEHVVDREAWVTQKTQPVPPSERREAVIARAPQDARPGELLNEKKRPAFEHELGLSYTQTIGGPDAFVLYQVAAVERLKLRLTDSTWAQGAIRLGLIDNYDKFKQQGESKLPQVRTLLREYVTTSDITIPHLQLTHVGRLTDNQYYSVYGGYLEPMFGGFGTEWLYRPFASRFAFGVDINAVKQREFSQHFGFRDYRVATGHATLYWDTGWNDVLATVQMGRYLAGDVGATLTLSRTFRNGVAVGAFATKTNVSAAEFGEGSFDKGLFISIPFEAVVPRSVAGDAQFLWRPLTRDGGAILQRHNKLYEITSARSDRTLWHQPAPLPNERVIPIDRQDEYKPVTKGPEPYTRVTSKTPAAQWERSDSSHELRLTEALYGQDFRNIDVRYDTSHRLLISLKHDGLRPISRAVGRTARTALRLAPLEAREIVITYGDGANPDVRYEFFDLQKLEQYFRGDLSAEDLRKTVKVEWLNPAARERDPLLRLADVDPESRPRVLTALVPDTLSASRIANDYVAAAETATKVNWLKLGAVGTSLILSASALDKRAHRFADNHASSRWLDHGVKATNAIPWLGFAAAGALALDGSDPKRSRTAYAAVEAGATALAVSTGLKYAIGRARPSIGLGPREFQWGASDDRYQSFPSRHTSVAWALATPFALEYDMPWLYGVAALTNLGRTGSREHWLSDTVASSLIGYAIGRVFWQSARDQAKGEPRLVFDGSTLGMLWDW
jgi:membrane-associated phospholipid phosphatase